MFSRRFLRIKAVKSLYWHFKSESDSIPVSEKNLVHSIDKAYDLYFQMLSLVADVKRYAEGRIEIARNKKLPTHEDLYPNLHFVENPVIAQIESSQRLNDYLTKKSLGWSRYPEMVKHLYNKMLGSDYYKAYMASTPGGYRDDLRFVQDFYALTVQDDEMVEGVLEEQSILWSDDMDFALIMVLKTLDGFRENQPDITLQREYKSEDDLVFVKELFRQAALHFEEYQLYIERFTVNWDVERIAFLDNIILVAAMAELVSFDSIPVKVTMDEYIEISKYYSTPGSSQFINGILDKVVESLKAEGRINKTGRGLLE